MLKTATTIIRESVQLYHANAKLFFKYIGLTGIPSLFLYGISMAIQARILERNVSDSGSAISTTLLIASGILAIIFSIISLWITIAFIRAIAASLNGQSANAPMHELALAKPTIFPVIIISILTSLIILGGFVLLIVPGILFLVWYGFSNFSVILDGKNSGAALKHSRGLVKGQWWDVAWRLAIPAIVFGLVKLAAQLIIMAPIGMALRLASDSPTILPLFAGIMSLAIGLILLPLTIIAQIILYIDLKKKRIDGISN